VSWLSRWAFRWRRSIPLLPFLRMNLTQRGVSSFTWHFGRWWSWNSRTGDTTVNPPGPGSVVRRGRRKRSAPRERRRDRWTNGSLW
jgi:hypothetical protein